MRDSNLKGSDAGYLYDFDERVSTDSYLSHVEPSV